MYIMTVQLINHFHNTQYSLVSVRDTCQGTNTAMSRSNDNSENKLRFLKNRYGGCQYVDGNLEIGGLDSESFYNEDLSFLNSIREVTGYVLIANVYVRNLTLENLTIIRGDKLFRPPSGAIDNASPDGTNRESAGYALFVSLNYKKFSDSIGMKLLGLRSLTGECGPIWFMFMKSAITIYFEAGMYMYV